MNRSIFLKGKTSINLVNLSTILVFVWLLFLLYMRNYVPINVLSLPFDDELFVRRADLVIQGDLFNFVSGYNPLVKGVAYPWLLVFSNFLNINPLLLTLVLLIIGVYAVGFTLFSKDQIVFLNLLLILTFIDPFFLKGSASRIARETLYGAALLLAIASILFFVKLVNSKRIHKSKFVLYAMFTGFFLLVAQNTREERSWIFLNVGLALVLTFFIIKKKSKKNYLLIILFSILTFTFYFVFTNMLKNFHYQIYNVYLNSTTVEGEFPRLLSNLSSIDTGQAERRYVSITSSKRELAYEVSPNFRKLSDYLEGPGGMWIQFGCENANICDDYANSYFHVALREAIKIEGYWSTQDQAQSFMAIINNEIENACNEKDLNCVDALPLAKGLGVTKISLDQIIDSLTFLRDYVNLSINNWDPEYSLKKVNLEFQEALYYSEMSPESWDIWVSVIPNLPSSQAKFKETFNYKTGKTIGVIQFWNYISSLSIKFGLIVLLILNLSLFFKRINIVINKPLLVIANFLLFVWLSRGVLLALNSTTNLISISEYYSLPGKIFLSLATAISFSLLVLLIKDLKTMRESRARRDSNP